VTPAFGLPFLIGGLGAVFLACMHRRVFRPRLAAWTLSIASIAVAVAAIVLLSSIALAWVGHMTPGDWLAICGGSASRNHISTLVGVGAFMLTLVLVIRASHTATRFFTAWTRGSSGEIEILSTRHVVAHARPNRGGPNRGTIVLSEGVISLLEPQELSAVIAHERSHLQHRHHRFVFCVNVAASLMPLLSPTRRALRFATERWADEDAAVAVGSRNVVAQAVARTALAEVREYRLPINGGPVVRRVDALTAPASPGSHVTSTTMIAASAGFVIAASALQVHHALGVLSHLCP
jgi:hypothetical protein